MTNTQRRGALADLKQAVLETGQFLLLLLNPGNRHARSMYEFYSTIPWGERSRYLNLGYWKDAQSFDDACQALAELVGEAAELGAEDRVLDVGFGYGDQDLFWARRFAPRRIDGVNITPHQVEIGQQRVAEQGLDDRIFFQVGSATALPFADGTFDKVIALESSLHFVTRDAFVREALRVLRPGGRLTLADVVPSAHAKQGLAMKLATYYWLSLTQTPRENYYPPQEYQARLQAAGFQDVRVQSIGEHVHAPFRRFMRERIQDKAFMRQFSPVLRTMFKASTLGPEHDVDSADYIIATADKPV